MVQLGMALPQFGADAAVEKIVAVAAGAEEVGLDSVWVMDRLLRPRAPVLLPGGPTIPLPDAYATVFDPLDTLAFVAARTSRVLLGTSAILALHHHPVVLARRFATVDRLSGGRLLAGVVQGWMAEEFAAMGVAAESRGARFDEHLAAMRATWRPDPVAFAGRFFEVPPSDIGPKPMQSGGVPLLMGYAHAAGIKRAARVADGLHPYTNDRAALSRDLGLFRATTLAAGRDPSAVPIVLRADGRLDAEAASAEDRPLFCGSLDQWREDVAAVQALGVGHLVFGLSGPVQQQLDTMAALRERVPRVPGELATRPAGQLSSLA